VKPFYFYEKFLKKRKRDKEKGKEPFPRYKEWLIPPWIYKERKEKEKK